MRIWDLGIPRCSLHVVCSLAQLESNLPSISRSAIYGLKAAVGQTLISCTCARWRAVTQVSTAATARKNTVSALTSLFLSWKKEEETEDTTVNLFFACKQWTSIELAGGRKRGCCHRNSGGVLESPTRVQKNSGRTVNFKSQRSHFTSKMTLEVAEVKDLVMNAFNHIQIPC